MKTSKLLTLLLFLLLSIESMSQVNNTNDQIASVKSIQTEFQTRYEFTPLSDFNEYKSQQLIQRFNTLLNDTASVVFENNKVVIRLNPAKINGTKLDDLLYIFTKTHGYTNYQINN